jgi:hypothetical protein
MGSITLPTRSFQLLGIAIRAFGFCYLRLGVILSRKEPDYGGKVMPGLAQTEYPHLS